MSARDAIENAYARYAWCYDMDELDGLAECFTEDAEVGFGTGVQVGREAVLQELRRRRDVYRPEGSLPWHTISNVFVRGERGTEADVVAFYTFFVKQPGAKPELVSIGHYDDLFVVEDGAWRIRRRRVVAA